MSAVEFLVLGGVAVRVDGAETPVAARREGSVLGLLLAAGGEPVTTDRVVDALWGEDAPDNAAASVQVAVSRLRTLVEPDRAPRTPPQRLVSTPAGYRLLSTDVDAARFDALAAAAADPAGDPQDRLRAADEALSLWRGRPYAGLDHLAPVAPEVARLEDVRVGVLESRAQALLDLGRHDLVATWLPAPAAEHPFRERLWGLLGLALYRCDRQADALAALRTLRERLVEELGVDPSGAIRDLEAAVLAQAPHLDGPAPTAQPARGDRGTAVPPQRDGRPPARRASDLPATPTLVTEGREEALAAARAAVDALGAGRGGVLVLAGEPGIGKSVLAAELARLAGTAGAQVLWGRCHEADVAPAYWPWLPVLRCVAGDDPAPELAALLGDADAVSADAGAALRTYDAAARALRDAARARPLVVVLEDIHWGDRSSLRLLAYAAQALEGAPVLLVVTRRTVDAPQSEALHSTLAALARLGATRVRMRGLPPAGVAHLVDGVLTDVRGELARVIADRTDGNPFFALELARLLAAGPPATAADAASVDVPDGVRDVLRLRLARLAEPTRQLLGVASVAGRDLDPGVLARVLDLGLPDVLDRLDEAVASGVVEESRGCYRFAHALTREAVSDELPPSRRVRWHAALAAALERQLETDPDLVADVAHHYVTASHTLVDLAPLAARHAEAAARQAERRSAVEEARDLWATAVAADERCGEPTTVEDIERRHRLLVGLATAQLRTGDFVGTRRSVDAAVSTARRVDRWDLVAQAAASFRGSGLWHWREFGVLDEAMIGVLMQCLDRLPDGPLRARVLASLQMEHTYGWHAEQADAYGEQSLVLARECGDDDVLADVLLLRTLALWGPGLTGTRAALARELLALPLDDEHRLDALWQLACALHQSGRPQEADETMHQAEELAARLRYTSIDVPLAWWRYMRATERDDPEAAALGMQALELHRGTTVVALHELTGMQAVRSRERGSDVPVDVVASARQSVNPAYRALVGLALAEAGRVDDAVSVLGPPAPPGARHYAALAGDCLRLETFVRAGRADLVPEPLGRLTPWAQEVATFGSVDALGSVHHFVAGGLAALGEQGVAAEHAERAVLRNREIGNLPWLRRAEARLDALRSGRWPDPVAAAGKPAASRR